MLRVHVVLSMGVRSLAAEFVDCLAEWLWRSGLCSVLSAEIDFIALDLFRICVFLLEIVRLLDTLYCMSYLFCGGIVLLFSC